MSVNNNKQINPSWVFPLMKCMARRYMVHSFKKRVVWCYFLQWLCYTRLNCFQCLHLYSNKLREENLKVYRSTSLQLINICRKKKHFLAISEWCVWKVLDFHCIICCLILHWNISYFYYPSWFLYVQFN